MSVGYYSVLARTLAAVEDDPAKLRGIVYKLARVELERELQRRCDAEMAEQMLAFEKAIEQVESDVKALPTATSQGVVDQDTETASRKTAVIVRQYLPEVEALEILPPMVSTWPFATERDWPRSAISRLGSRSASVDPVIHRRAGLWWYAQLATAVILGMTIYVVGETRGFFGYWQSEVPKIVQVAVDHPQETIAVATPKVPNTPVVLPTIAGAPLPTTYGVYAVNHGKLIDLGLLPIRVPDQRVGVSAMISTPSRAILPDGQLQFVAFRRDLVNDAPDQATVRVVARVMRALTFNSAGQAKIKNIADTWAIRSNVYYMRVAPVSGNPEMIVVRPDKPDFSFSPGRYALVLNNFAYDFTVAGPITNTEQCLERTDAVNMPVYSECRIP
jgi:hypothetical protein